MLKIRRPKSTDKSVRNSVYLSFVVRKLLSMKNEGNTMCLLHEQRRQLVVLHAIRVGGIVK